MRGTWRASRNKANPSTVFAGFWKTRVLWQEAYVNMYANDGATTPGTDNTTLDGFSEERLATIIARLKHGSYRFQPARRTYVPKKNGKKRPHG